MSKGSQNGRFYQESASSRKADGRKKIVLIIITAVILAVIIIAVVLILKSCSDSADDGNVKTVELPTTSEIPTIAIQGNPIESAENVMGEWTLDGVTSYEFYDDGTGNLITSTTDFLFYYAVEGNILTLDFADDSVTDALYECYLDTDTLTFDDTATQRMYVLTRR